MLHLIWFLLIGLAAGWLAGQILHTPGFGLGGYLIIGVVGAVLGGFLFSLVQLQTTGLLGELISATVGAVLLIVLLRRMRRMP